MALSEIASTSGSAERRRVKIGFNEDGAILLGVAVLLFGFVVLAATGPLLEKTDFTLTYVGARLIHQGEGLHLYDLGRQVRLRNSLFKHPNPLFFEHPPFEALLFAPLSVLPFKTAYLIWGFVNVLLWLILSVLLRPYVPAPKETLGYFGLWLIFAPLFVALFQGQTSVMVLLSYAMAYINLKRQKDLRAGSWLGLGLFKFQFVLPLVLIFMLRKKWRFLAGFALSTTLLGVLSLLAVKWWGLLEYARLLYDVSHHPANESFGSAVDMPTLHGFVYALLGPTLGPGGASLLAAVLSALLIVMVAWCWRQADRQTPGDADDLMFAAAVTVSLVTGSHMFTHDFSPMILALLLVVVHFPGQRRRALRIALAVSLAILWTPPIYFVLVACHCLYLMFPILLVFGMVALRLAAIPAKGVRCSADLEVGMP